MEAAGSHGGNGSRNGDRKRPADKPEPSDVSKAKRKLWERDEESEREFQELEERKSQENLEEKIQEYNFDFRRGVPLLPGRYAWKKISEISDSDEQSTSISGHAASGEISPGSSNQDFRTVKPDTEDEKTQTEIEQKNSRKTVESENNDHNYVKFDKKSPEKKDS